LAWICILNPQSFSDLLLALISSLQIRELPSKDIIGPTVIVPLLRQVPLTSKLAAILRWEGILIDPLGAMLAVLVFEASFADGMHEALKIALLGAGKTIFLGVVIGLLGAGLIVFLIKRDYIPDYLQIPATLTVIVSVFATANLLQGWLPDHPGQPLSADAWHDGADQAEQVPVRSLSSFALGRLFQLVAGLTGHREEAAHDTPVRKGAG
jgi:hypothetical protein